MTLDRVVQFAQKQGYDSAEALGTWGNYDVYEPFFNGEDVTCMGLPLVILVAGDKIRMSTPDEALKISDIDG